MSDVVVTNMPRTSRYEATVGGKLAGTLDYELDDRTIVFTHTNVDASFEGMGVGSALVAQAIAEVRGKYVIKAECPFVAAWLQRHPEAI